MAEAKNGYAFLQMLKERNGREKQTYKDFAGYLEQKARKTATPLNGQFELTPLCNLDCKMCYVHLQKEQLLEKPVMTVAQWKDLMGQAVDAGMLYAILTGGECLAYPGFEELYLYLQGLGCNVMVMTNGLLLDEEKIRFFTQNRPEEIQITLYGGNEDVYEKVTGRRVFQTVYDNARKAVAAGLPILLSLTPNSFLGDGIYDAVRAAKSICDNVKINFSLFTPRESTGRAGQKDEVPLDTYVKALVLLKELRGQTITPIPEEEMPPPGGPHTECRECGIQCGAGRSTFTITWDGRLIPCNRLEMMTYDLEKDGFRNAWKAMNKQAEAFPRIPACEGCPYEPSCPRCAGDLIRFAVPGNRPEWLCQRAIAFVRHGIWQIPDCE